MVTSVLILDYIIVNNRLIIKCVMVINILRIVHKIIIIS